MGLYHILRRTCTVLSALCITIAILLSSCRAAGPQDADKAAALSLLAPYRLETEKGEGSLYDITPLIGEDADEILAYSLASKYSLLFLQREASADGSSDSHFALRLLDLRDGSLTTCASFPQADPSPGQAGEGRYEAHSAAPGEDRSAISGEEQDFEILSADPEVIFDRRSGVLYQPSSDIKTVRLPAWLRDCALFCRDGQVWLSSDRGILYTITGDGSIDAVWKLPCEYGATTPVVSGHEGRLTFATYSAKVPSERIFVDVDLQTGGSEFYLSDLDPGRFQVYADGILLGTSFRTAPKVSVCSLSSHTKKEMQLPDQMIALLRGTSADEPSANDSGSGQADPPSGGNSGSVSFSTVPLSVCGDWCTFMLRSEQGYPVRIYLWDTENCAALNWNGPSIVPYETPAPADYGELSRTAQELEDKYGVRIVLGDNIPSEFTDYTAETVTDPSIIKNSLAVLENTLSLYPEDYFADLCGNYFRGVAIYLTGALSPLNAASSISNASAFSTESGGLMQVAFDLYSDLDPSTVVHELTHAADYRFLGEGLMDEEAWNAMNPEGFDYYYSYIDASGESYEISGSTDHTAAGGSPASDVYFIDPYSKTYPMEDRARLMEYLLAGDDSPYAYCFSSEHVQEKLSYYFRFLRDTLASGSWPARTAWEEALHEASASP